MNEAGKMLLPVPDSFCHAAWGFEPFITFTVVSTEQTHVLRLKLALVRWSLAAFAAAALLPMGIIFAFMIPSAFQSSLYGLILAALMAAGSCGLAVALALACADAVRVTRRLPVRCVLIGQKCVQVGGEAVDQEVSCIELVQQSDHGYRTRQWHLVSCTGSRWLLHQETSSGNHPALPVRAIEQFAAVAKLPVRSL